jgi:hypothetical protein
MDTSYFREEAVWRLCGRFLYCEGLKKLGGKPCPISKKFLSIGDIQIGHLKKDKFRGRSLYFKVLRMKNPKNKYIPLCTLCNQRMISLCQELFRYPEKFRLKAAKYASKVGRRKARLKFMVNVESLTRWQREFNIPPFKAPLKYSLLFRKKIFRFSIKHTISETSKKFNVSRWLIWVLRKENNL